MTLPILNLLDLIFTLHAITHGGVELNPLLQSVPLMLVYKLTIIPALIWWLSGSDLPIAKRGMKFCTAVFAAVNLWHIVNIAAVWAV
jgi:hypothetical protein